MASAIYTLPPCKSLGAIGYQEEKVTQQGTNKRWVTKPRLMRLLDEMEGTMPQDSITLYITPKSLANPLDSLWETDTERGSEISEALDKVRDSESGVVLFWSQERKLIVLPPFPVNQDAFHHGWSVSTLRELLAREYTLGVVLVRLGRYAIGVFQGEHLVASKTDTRYVKGRHHAGGTSQKRFQRIREGQIQRLYHKVCSIAAEKFGPLEHQLDYVVLGGERFTLLGLLKECTYLQGLSPKILKRAINVPDPGHQTLLKAPSLIWRSQIIEANL